MKTAPFVLVAVMALAASVRSQVTDAVDSREPAPVPVAAPVTARIIGDIPDGTPPPPQPPKPEFVISENEVIQTAIHEQGGRTITIRRIKPI